MGIVQPLFLLIVDPADKFKHDVLYSNLSRSVGEKLKFLFDIWQKRDEPTLLSRVNDDLSNKKLLLSDLILLMSEFVADDQNKLVQRILEVLAPISGLINDPLKFTMLNQGITEDGIIIAPSASIRFEKRPLKMDQMFQKALPTIQLEPVNRTEFINTIFDVKCNALTYDLSIQPDYGLPVPPETIARPVAYHKFQIFVNSLQDTTISIHIDPTCAVNHLRHAICASKRIPVCYQRWLSRCRDFQDDSRLSDLYLAGETITLLGRLMGGNPEPNPRLMPVTWWLPFGRSYQDGRTGEEGRICNVLTKFEFNGREPDNWFLNQPLSEWGKMKLIESEEDVFQGIIGLNLSGSRLKSLPESIKSLDSLIELIIYGNHLTSLPESIGYLSNLTELYVSENNLISLPESIGNLSSLSYLYLYNNQLTRLPDSIGRLSSLTVAFFSNNQLDVLPESIGSLTSLRNLNASHNRFKALPDSLWNLQYLEQLNVSFNQIAMIPESIGELSLLFNLDISHNHLTALPQSIGGLTHLIWFNGSENPLTSTIYGRALIHYRLTRTGLSIKV